MNNTRGQFGTDSVQEWPTTIEMNEKGGMDNYKFEIYNSIVPLFPDVKDIPGKRVIIKIDSGPGQTNIKFLAKLLNLVFLLYPGVTNNTSVSQETDNNYEPLKRILWNKMDTLTISNQVS